MHSRAYKPSLKNSKMFRFTKHMTSSGRRSVSLLLVFPLWWSGAGPLVVGPLGGSRSFPTIAGRAGTGAAIARLLAFFNLPLGGPISVPWRGAGFWSRTATTFLPHHIMLIQNWSIFNLISFSSYLFFFVDGKVAHKNKNRDDIEKDWLKWNRRSLFPCNLS